MTTKMKYVRTIPVIITSAVALWSMAIVTALPEHDQPRNGNSTQTTAGIRTAGDLDTVATADSNSTVFVKLCAAVILPTTSIVASLVPVVLAGAFHRNEAKNRAILFEQTMAFVLFFSGGVLMCTVFLHLLPDLRASSASSFPNSPINNTYPELIVCFGFFFVYTLEQVLHSYLTRRLSRTSDATAVCERSAAVAAKSNGDADRTTTTPTNYAGHCDFAIDQLSKSNLVSNVLTVVALSAHEIFEGMAVGLERTVAMVWFMTGAIVCHKTVLATFVGSQMTMTKSKRSFTYIVISVYALTSSVGILVGLIVSTKITASALSTAAVESDSTQLIKFVLQGIATGTLLYVVFFEIFAKKNEQTNRLGGQWKALAAILGFAFMCRLQG